MIFYFTGTGNSLQASKNIAIQQGEKLISIAKLMKDKDEYEYTLEEGEILGFVFPVHAWGPPHMVVDLIKKLKINNYKDNYVFSVITCGANIGNAMKIIEKELYKVNIPLNSGFSLVMPDNYMLIGLGVDPPEKSAIMLQEAEKKLIHINDIIRERKKGIFEIEKGALPSLLTNIFNPMFMKYAINTKKFHAKDNCTSCGICEKVCNTKCIKVEGKPIWGDNCSLCLACINLCPVSAIQYGKSTEKRRRYKNPNISIEELGIN